MSPELTEEERDEILAEVQAEAEVWPPPTAEEVAIAVETTERLTKRRQPWEEMPFLDPLPSQPAAVPLTGFDPFAD
ncbi:hypothetical protein [Mycolicibacter algericus]|uniref:hypothetical protein n=1 Tax=Mycolicibacter algericus TaxID=1288388 RepID=UPI003C766A60